MRPIQQHWSELDEPVQHEILKIHSELDRRRLGIPAKKLRGRTTRRYLLDQALEGRRHRKLGNTVLGEGILTHVQRQMKILRHGEHVFNPAQGHANETPAEFARNVDTLWHMSAGWR